MQWPKTKVCASRTNYVTENKWTELHSLHMLPEISQLSFGYMQKLGLWDAIVCTPSYRKMALEVQVKSNSMLVVDAIFTFLGLKSVNAKGMSQVIRRAIFGTSNGVG
jgi:hypothetical protein